MKKLKLIRHAQSVHNSDGIIQGQQDVPLSEKGVRQAEHLAENLDTDYDALYSSKLERAISTAEKLSESSGKEIRKRSQLNERSLGVLEGSDSSVWSSVDKSGGADWKPEGGESLRDHRARVREFLDEVKEAEEEDVVALCHGGTIRAAISEVVEIESVETWRIRADNCGVTELRHTERGWTIAYVNRSAEEA